MFSDIHILWTDGWITGQWLDCVGLMMFAMLICIRPHGWYCSVMPIEAETATEKLPITMFLWQQRIQVGVNHYILSSWTSYYYFE
jgi:hypothetical protein